MPNRSPETNALIAYLKTCADTQEIATYERMSAFVYDDIHKYRSKLSSTLRVMEKEYGYVAMCIRNVGYRFLKNNGVPSKVSETFQAKIKGCVERAASSLATVEWTKLSDDDLKKAISCSIRIQAHRQLTTSRVLKACDKVAANSDRFIDSAKAAANLMKNIG